MLLGKRPEPPIRRSTSSAEFPAVVFDIEAHRPADNEENEGAEDFPLTRYMLPQSGISGDLEEEVAAGTASSMGVCGLCNRRLGPGRDIYMYRGDIAFCSLECRQQQMNLDEQKKK
ncbi:hypothetical protein Cni_G02722 [Canna indica]|uniref:FLZ-type domain-containing protein n=1 Tax=Canna indica TaxID=4628 RepID=A0AAQ3Q097_9LILI|nr:hypothetical protein Cni_G02722 [Canna indica]